MLPETPITSVELRTAAEMNSLQAPQGGVWFGSRQDFEYDIFISYRRGDGLRIAEWLSRRLRAYRPPRGFPRTLSPLRVYRDVERERVTPAIWEERIRPTLVRSRFLIVVLTESVVAPTSGGPTNWVIREVTGFLETPHGSNVMIVRGDPGVPLPPEITARFPDSGMARRLAVTPAVVAAARGARRASRQSDGARRARAGHLGYRDPALHTAGRT